MKKLFAILLVLTLLLCGCAKQPEATEPVPTVDNPTEDVNVSPTEPSVTKPKKQYQNPLTGEAVAQPVTTRPFAVVINNIYDAQPLHGISQADIFYEYVVEGGGSITRCLALFSDPSKVGPIGSIRSARTYNISIARSYNALFAHAGGSYLAENLLSQKVVSDLDAGAASPEYFYRDQARRSAGYALEHTMFTTGEKMMAYAEKRGFKTELGKEYDVGLKFSDNVQLNGQSAKSISLHFNSANGKGSLFSYDEKQGLYNMTQEFYGKHLLSQVDGNNNKEVTFRNVLVLRAVTTLHSDGTHVLAQLTGEGTGYFACGGKMVPIKWSRPTEDAPFAYTLEDGTPITLGVGHTYVGIVSTKSPVEFR